MVGAVLVHEDRIIGEGWHKRFGGPHAEVEAIASVKEGDRHLIERATLFVTLEPCCHFGKTPPCTELILSKNIKKVVIGTSDPNPLVEGKGLSRLAEQGVEIELGVFQKEAALLNRRFITNVKKRRPYVILKWAQTRDGFIAPSLDASVESKKISNPLSHVLVHKWRAEEDAIMVGYNTLLYDDPRLNVRLVESLQQPIRVTWDEKGGDRKEGLSFFDGSQESIVFNYEVDQIEGRVSYIQLKKEEEAVAQMLAMLNGKGIGSLIVEGGTKLITKFITSGLWDEARICTSSKMIEKGIPAPFLFGNVEDKMEMEEDVWEIISNPQEKIEG
jgi:diaminohydroxyphosphoribosylaminopyrimidine deaminase/5-amino-6-(5-phosphoribosylamino)uracil reductase